MNRLTFYLIITVNELTSDIIMPRPKNFFDMGKTTKFIYEKSFLNQSEIIWTRPKYFGTVPKYYFGTAMILKKTWF